MSSFSKLLGRETEALLPPFPTMSRACTVIYSDKGHFGLAGEFQQLPVVSTWADELQSDRKARPPRTARDRQGGYLGMVEQGGEGGMNARSHFHAADPFRTQTIERPGHAWRGRPNKDFRLQEEFRQHNSNL